MAEHIHLQFRPSLIIFVGKAGRDIHNYFGLDNLLAYLDAPLRQSVGLLHIDTAGQGSDTAHVLPSGSPLQNDPDFPVGSGAWEEMIYRSLLSVQLDRRRLAINSAGYAVPDPRAQIYIVGELTDENAPWMAYVLRLVREQIQSHRFDTMVCYILNSYQATENHSATLSRSWEANRQLEWHQYALANFSYLYEYMITHPFPTFLSQDEVHYVSAEALFALVSTGIAAVPVFQDEMRLPPTLQNYSDYVGGLTTSMIRFPRQSVSRYSSAQLSSELMQKWYEDLDKSDISDQERRLLQAQASAVTQEVRNWIDDTVPRPASGENLWPTLGVLRTKNATTKGWRYARQLDAHRQLADQSAKLFKTLVFANVSREYHAQRQKTESWLEIADRRLLSAVDAFVNWESLARIAWDATSERIGNDFSIQVDKLWPVSNNGFEKARIYVVELDNQLTSLADRVTQWRTRHHQHYRQDQSRFSQLSQEGPWIIDAEDASIKGASVTSAKPTWAGQGPGAHSTHHQPTFSHTPGSSGGAPSPAPRPVGPQHLPPAEEEISLNLKRRIGWKQKQIPVLPSLGATSFLGWLTSAFALVALSLPLNLLIVANAALALAFVMGSMALRWQREDQFRNAQKELLEFYRRYYAFRCESREDIQRMNLMRILRTRVTNMRVRLETIYDFIMYIQQSATQETQKVENDLFNGPTGVRDIFVANGERLEQHGNHRLHNIAKQVTQLRLNRPVEDWHRTLDEMKDKLIETLRQNTVSLIEATPGEAQEHIYNFTARVVNRYLTGSLVDISATLDKPEIWRAVLDRAIKPLYFSQVGIREPRLLFICGSKKDLNTSRPYIPNDAITVETNSTEWLMVVAFFRGGSPTAINADKLFLPWVPPTPGSGGGSGPSDPGGSSGPGAASTAAAASVPAPGPSLLSSSSQPGNTQQADESNTTLRRLRPSSRPRISAPQRGGINSIGDDTTQKK